MQIKIYKGHTKPLTYYELLGSLSRKYQEVIHSRIKYISENRRWLPELPYALDLKRSETSMFEFRIPIDDENLVRIHYFIDRSNSVLVILNCYIKPDGIKNPNSYNKANKREIEYEIESNILEAIRLKWLYPHNQNDYDILN